MPRLRQRYELEMAIGFPQVFDVADDSIVPVVERLAECERSKNSRFWVSRPWRWESYGCVVHRKDVKSAVKYSLGRGAVALCIKGGWERRHPGFRRSSGSGTRDGKSEAKTFELGFGGLPGAE
jgi:hypothetical protein